MDYWQARAVSMTYDRTVASVSKSPFYDLIWKHSKQALADYKRHSVTVGSLPEDTVAWFVDWTQKSNIKTRELRAWSDLLQVRKDIVSLSVRLLAADYLMMWDRVAPLEEQE